MANNTPEEAEKIAGMAQPAVFVNRFVVSAGPEVTRISFIETGDPGTGFCRFAIVMRKADALALTNLINLLYSEGTKQ